MKIVIHVKYWDFRYVLAIHVICLSNLDFNMMILMFKIKQPVLSVNLFFLPKFLQSSIYVVHNLGLSLITLINYCSKYFKMVMLSRFWNRIKTGDHWTLKNLFNNLFNNILDRRCLFFHRELLSFHPLWNFAVVIT